MLVYPENTLEKLEFLTICEQVARYCSGQVSRNAALAMRPSDDFDEILELLNQAEGFHQIREHGLSFPEFRYMEASKELGMLKISGAVLEGRQFMLLREMNSMAADLVKGVKRLVDFPALQQMVHHLQPDDTVQILVDRVLNENGSVKTTASRELANIRRSIDELRKKTSKIFDGLLRNYRKAGWLREYGESVYHDRRVFAVVAEHKNKLNGVIHGSSESGNTAFVEPAELVNINNELISALSDEKKEEHKILRQLTKEVAVHEKLLNQYFLILADFDLLEAKSKLFRKLNAIKPHLRKNCERLIVRQGYHPVLMQKNQAEGLKTIPLELELTPEDSILVISGPNAGGKSVALKTVGLLQMMVQSGLLIPVHESSELPVFAQLLVDIGDDQSIEQQLSTYSSRLRKMKHFLRVADSRSLILLDEFGTGSDPELGGAIAESILIHLLKHHPWGVITTHFGNIKVAAQNLDGIRNGSMLFDEETLEPQYQLQLNVPGSSYTFEVARKIGMDRKVLDLARKKVDSRKLKLDQVLVEMQQQLKQVEFERSAIDSERKLLQREFERIAEEKKEIQSFRASQQKAEFKRLTELGKKYEDLIESWNQPGKRKELLQRIIQAAAEKKMKVQKAAVKQKGAGPAKKIRKKKSKPLPIITEGDRVRLRDGKSVGTVVGVDQEMVQVVFGNMKMRVKNDQLVLAMKKSSK